VLRAVVLTQYRRVTDGQTDGQTDGIAVASTALASRHAVKTFTRCRIPTTLRLVLLICVFGSGLLLLHVDGSGSPIFTVQRSAERKNLYRPVTLNFDL